ncbi:MAG: hypothetical protein JEZ06_21615 [Anaerolineaceae bacterium]|nr:hypothetical protein [Anaerolineaceae bacterium]
MPFKYFICETTGEHTAPLDCIECARQGARPGCQMTPAILSGIIRQQRPNSFALEKARQAWNGQSEIDHALTVTELLGCPRKNRLMKEVDWGEKPANLYWAYRGTLFHNEAELYAEAEPTVVSEERLFWFFRFNGQVVALSGQPDLLVYRPEGWHILDYKTIKQIPGQIFRHICAETGAVIYESQWKVRGKQVNCPHCVTKHPIGEITIQKLPPQPRGSHLKQIQFYSLLIEQNSASLAGKIVSDEVLDEAPVNSAEIVYLDMSGALRLAVPVWSREECVALLRDRLALHMNPEPDILKEPEDLWVCDYCPVRGECERQFGGPVGKAMLEAQAVKTA